MNTVFQQAGLQIFERGWLSSNNLLFHRPGSAEAVLVDSGYHSHSAQTVALVRGSLGNRPLDRIVNTHLHSDHCGGNRALQLAFDCSIDVPCAEARTVDEWDEDRLSFSTTGQGCPRFTRTGLVAAGTEIELAGEPWKVIGAPGHDPSSVMLYQPEFKVLISADALWQHGFGVVFPELDGVAAFEVVRCTLDQISTLAVEWVIPGHGQPFQDVGEALGRAHSRLRYMERNPRRHGGHAARVLVKFHLMEMQHQTVTAVLTWMRAVPIFRTIHQRYFADLDEVTWHRSLIADLCSSGALALEAGVLRDM